MIDLKKIADAVRVIREAYAPLVSTVCDGLTAIIDELDPPAKPLLADARVGDLCQRRDGKWVQIDSVSHDRPCPVMCKSDIGGQDCFTLDGRNHNAVNNDKDIIHTEPLAEEGTAEWAWQMMKLGKPVSHPAEGEFQDTYYTKAGFVRCMAKTGWQLYEEPEFKVGDFVKYDIDTYLRVIEPSGKVRTLCKTLSGVIVYPYTSCLTKASPSEVIVKIGCLEGTVVRYSNTHFKLIHKEGFSMIKFSALDTPTRSLVESLLKAQEEKCHS